MIVTQFKKDTKLFVPVSCQLQAFEILELIGEGFVLVFEDMSKIPQEQALQKEAKNGNIVSGVLDDCKGSVENTESKIVITV